MAVATIEEYGAGIAESLRPVAAALAAALDDGFERAVGTVWHAHPVWMIGKTPVGGFKAYTSYVTLMFWRGAEIDSGGALSPAKPGSMANIRITSVDDVDAAAVAAWAAAAEALEPA